jgi:hypothetical protein
MSYATSAALQTAIYTALTNDATVMALCHGAIHDKVPTGPVPDLYISLGPERARDLSDKTKHASEHEFQVTIIANGAGFQQIKTVAGAISDALTDAQLTLTRGQLISLNFLRAEARREDTTREIDLWFLARIDDTAL